MIKRKIIILIFALANSVAALAQNDTTNNEGGALQATPLLNRLQIGGYGEAVLSRMFHSNNYKRYTNAALYKDDKGFGQVDLPHVVFFLGYDFGKGWKFGTEVEFEHGGFEGAIEIEEEETGEYESEIERGGEVAIEQWWIEKSFKYFTIRMGHIIVPVGATNKYHMPNEYFGVFRPQSESTILPCTWHETGAEIYGSNYGWNYEVMFIAGLDADRFGSKKWIGSSSGSPYEFKLATGYAGAFRLENTSLLHGHLRLGISGYLGQSAANSLKSANYSKVNGIVSIGGFDFEYNNERFIARGSIIYGHLTDSKKITEINLSSRRSSPSPKTHVASDAISIGFESAYDVFSFFPSLRMAGHKLYVFKRFEFYDPMFKVAPGVLKNDCWRALSTSFGLNYKPMKAITLKAQYALRILDSKYNNEPSISIGVTYSGMFKK